MSYFACLAKMNAECLMFCCLGLFLCSTTEVKEFKAIESTKEIGYCSGAIKVPC